MTKDTGPDQPEPLRADELALVQQVVDALEESPGEDAFDSVRMIRHQLRSLRMFAELLGRYPSPLQDQFLYGKRRGLDTLVDKMVAADLATFPPDVTSH